MILPAIFFSRIGTHPRGSREDDGARLQRIQSREVDRPTKSSKFHLANVDVGLSSRCHKSVVEYRPWGLFPVRGLVYLVITVDWITLSRVAPRAVR